MTMVIVGIRVQGCESDFIDQGRSHVDNNISISNCFFSRYLSYSGNGGVIYVTVNSCSMNINFSMFYNCFCSVEGGAIFFNSLYSYLRMICANCCSASFSHFAYLRASQMNLVEYLSVSKCFQTTIGSFSILLNYGNQRVDNINSSMNNANWGSGIYIWSPSSYTSSHCTFSNNKVADRYCICLGSTSEMISMTYANIVHNNSPNNGVVTFSGTGSKKMMYCIFHNNQDYLFCVNEGSLEVSHSFIDHPGSFSTSIAVSTSNNNSLTNRLTYLFQFFYSLHCNADIPLIATSIVFTIEKSPIRTIEDTIRRTNEDTLRMTYERTIDQTKRETPKVTIHRSYAELICTYPMAYKREICAIFSFLYPVIILMIS